MATVKELVRSSNGLMNFIDYEGTYRDDNKEFFKIDEKVLHEVEAEIAYKLDIQPEEVIIDMPEALSFEKMDIKVETSNGLKPLSQVSTIIDSLNKAEYNYSNLELYLSKENREKAYSKNIKIENYLTLPSDKK